MGLALRALGNDLAVCIFQFMKAETDISGEIAAIEKHQNMIVERYGGNLLGKFHTPVEEIKAEIGKGLEKACDMVNAKKCDILILDEINLAVSKELVKVDVILEIVELCSAHSIELVITGRNAPQEIINKADYVTEMNLIKHPYSRKIRARSGIEY